MKIQYGSKHDQAEESLGATLGRRIFSGNFEVIDPNTGKSMPFEFTGISEGEKQFFENHDFEGLMRHYKEKGYNKSC